MHFCARCSILSYTRRNSAVSIRRTNTAELQWVYDNMLQRAQKCIDVQGDHFQHLLLPVSTLHLHLFNFQYRVRDLRPRWSTRRRAGFSCAILYSSLQVLPRATPLHARISFSTHKHPKSRKTNEVLRPYSKTGKITWYIISLIK